MPFRKKSDEPVADETPDGQPAGGDDQLTLAEAEAAAAEAEARAAAARAQAIRLREQASATATTQDATVSVATDGAQDYDEAVPVGVDTDEGKRARSIWQPLRWVAGTLTVLAIAALITLSVLMIRHHHDVSDRQQRAAEYIAAGRQGVVTLMSLNFNSIDEDIQRILDNTTGEFRKDFEDKTNDFVEVAKESKVITEATSTAAGLESMDGNEAVVLVSASTKVTNQAGAIQEPRSWRLVIHLVREGDQIKMSKVDFAP